MVCDASPPDYLPGTIRHPVKIVITGALGVGKTTLIRSVSEIRPLHTEEPMTAAAAGVDDLAGLPGKATTTVAMDFGRVTLSDRIVLYLYGTPGQQRLWGWWRELAWGAIGALILIDTRRLDHSFTVFDQLERHNPALPLVVAVNQFPDAPAADADELRAALDRPDVPVVYCDARRRLSSCHALVALVEHALQLKATPA